MTCPCPLAGEPEFLYVEIGFSKQQVEARGPELKSPQTSFLSHSIGQHKPTGQPRCKR